MKEFAKTSEMLFARQFKESLVNTPKTARFIAHVLKGDGRSFTKNAKFFWEVGKGDLASMQVVGRAIKEQWNESIESLPQHAKTIARYSCLYCDQQK